MRLRNLVHGFVFDKSGRGKTKRLKNYLGFSKNFRSED